MDSIRMVGSATLCQALVITAAWVHSASAWFSNNSLTDVRNRYIRMIKMRKRIMVYVYIFSNCIICGYSPYQSIIFYDNVC